MGGLGGSLWHGIKGFKNSPRVLPPGVLAVLLTRVFLV